MPTTIPHLDPPWKQSNGPSLPQSSPTTIRAANALSKKKSKFCSRCGEEEMLEYVASALLGLVMIGCMLYVTMSPEADEPPDSKRPDPKQ